MYGQYSRASYDGVCTVHYTDYGRPERKQPSLHGRKLNPNPNFLGMAAAYFFCHIGPIFQISLIYSVIGCPQFVAHCIGIYVIFIHKNSIHTNKKLCSKFATKFVNFPQPSIENQITFCFCFQILLQTICPNSSHLLTAFSNRFTCLHVQKLRVKETLIKYRSEKVTFMTN